jgi:anti-sigma B factor antagonist
LNYISSAGLGVFMAFIENIRDKGGDIKFSSMSEKIYNVFDLIGFPLIYEFYKSDDEAIQKFKSSKV